MAANYSSLIIDNKHSSPSYNIVPPNKIDEMPKEVDDAGVNINHAILAGEIMGLPVEESIEVMEILHRTGNQLQNDFPDRPYHGVPLIRDLGEELKNELALVFLTLKEAVDEEGRAKGKQGDMLKSSPRIGMDDNERLFVKSHHIYLFNLIEKLEKIIELLEYGFNNNLLIRLV